MRAESRSFDVGELQKAATPSGGPSFTIYFDMRTLKAGFVMAQHYPFPLSQIMSRESLKPKAFRECVWGGGVMKVRLTACPNPTGKCALSPKPAPPHPPIEQSFHHQNFEVFIISSKLGSHYTFSVIIIEKLSGAESAVTAH